MKELAIADLPRGRYQHEQWLRGAPRRFSALCDLRGDAGIDRLSAQSSGADQQRVSTPSDLAHKLTIHDGSETARTTVYRDAAVDRHDEIQDHVGTVGADGKIDVPIGFVHLDFTGERVDLAHGCHASMAFCRELALSERPSEGPGRRTPGPGSEDSLKESMDRPRIRYRLSIPQPATHLVHVAMEVDAASSPLDVRFPVWIP